MMLRRQFTAGTIGFPYVNAIARARGQRPFSRSGLRRMHDIMASYVDRRHVPGAVWLISKRGVVHAEAMGYGSLGGSKAMLRDTIFRIASMTKPVAAVAGPHTVEGIDRIDDHGPFD